MASFKQTESERLLKEIEKALNYYKVRSKYIEYGTGSKSNKEATNQFTMNYQGFKIKVQIFKV